MYVCVYVCVSTRAKALVWKSEENVRESGIELRNSGLVASIFIVWALLLD